LAGILTHEQKQLAFRLRARGWRLVDIAREIGCSAPMVGLMVRDGQFTAGVPDEWEPRPGCLGIAEREILVGIRADDSVTEMARRLGRAASTISREVAASIVVQLVAGVAKGGQDRPASIMGGLA
jgi:transposase, IS30 family